MLFDSVPLQNCGLNLSAPSFILWKIQIPPNCHMSTPPTTTKK
uniref:Uncharacterized protein n=1 Tax=Arundo donax TaxID=35708 RepID=A0A0A9GQZ1_ARUDO